MGTGGRFQNTASEPQIGGGDLRFNNCFVLAGRAGFIDKVVACELLFLNCEKLYNALHRRRC